MSVTMTVKSGSRSDDGDVDDDDCDYEEHGEMMLMTMMKKVMILRCDGRDDFRLG